MSEIRADRMVRIVKGLESEITVTYSEALNIAEKEELDLVVLNETSDCIIAKLVNIEKENYEKQKKLKKQQKEHNKKQLKDKDIRVDINCGENDLKVKAKTVDRLLREGSKIKISLILKGRMKEHKEMGIETVNKLAGYITEKYNVQAPLNVSNESYISMVITSK